MEEKKIEAIKKKSTELIYEIFELSQDATSISEIDDGKFIYVNSAFEKLFVVKTATRVLSVPGPCFQSIAGNL